MKGKYFVIWAVILMLISLFLSRVEALEEWGKPYVVKKGDTLWDISQRFYGNPLYWPFIWDSNKKLVVNPHWIYPRERLIIPEASKLPLTEGKDLKLESPTAEKLPLVGPELSLYASYISKEKVKSPYKITSAVFDPDKSMFGQVEEVVVGVAKDAPPIKPGDLFMVVRNETKIKYKGKRPVKGWEVRCAGVAKIEKVAPHKAQGVVVGASFTILTGDLLLPYQPPYIIYKLRPAPEVEGEVIKLPGEKDVGALMDYIFVNIGKKEGLEPGMVLDVYSPLGIGNVVGRLVVLKVQNETSSCYLFNSRSPLEVGMIVKGGRP